MRPWSATRRSARPRLMHFPARFPARFTARALTLLLTLAACRADRPTSPRDDAAPVRNKATTAEGYASRGELRHGYVVGRDGAPLAVSYEVHGGLAIWEGDIVLGLASAIAASPEALRRQVPGAGTPRRLAPRLGVVIDGAGFRWPAGKVPYEIDGTLTNQARVTTAMALIEQSTAGVNFVVRSGEADYVRFVPSDGCSSWIGKQGGMQTINLADGCSSGNAAHEMLHALAMFHEQSRCDRDTYVEIHLENVQSGKENNFDKACDDATDLGDYAEGSMMHYGATAFSKNGSATIVSKRGLDALMGQRGALGATDVATINALYGSNNVAPVAAIAALAPSYVEGSAVAFDGSASSDADDAVLTFSWNFGDGTCPVVTPPAECSAASPSHGYADNGAYTAALTVSDGFLTNSTSRVATVVNAIPVVNAGADVTLTSGQTLAFAGSFSDVGVNDAPWAYTIDWGVGAATTGSSSNQAAAITSSRQFCAAGTYAVSLSVTDKDGGTGTDARSVTVPYFGVSIDIVPGSSPNPVNMSSKGLVPVAILSTATFDARAVNLGTVTLGDGAGIEAPAARQTNGRYQAKITDINGDGRLDLLVMFESARLVANGDLTAATTQLVLRGYLANGCTNLSGADAVKVVP